MIGNALADIKCAPYRSCTLLALTLAVFSACAWPQTQLATVFGTITDPSGAVIPAAHVTIVNQSMGLKREVLTGMTGQYHLAGLPTGDYVVRVEKPGFQTQLRAGITLTSALEVMINISLAIGDLRQQVSVTSSGTAIDNTTSTVGGVIAERSLTELPLNGRDLFNAVVLEPGVAPTPSTAPSLLSSGKVGQVSINGMRPSWTNVLIDGMDANDPVFGFSPAGASATRWSGGSLGDIRATPGGAMQSNSCLYEYSLRGSCSNAIQSLKGVGGRRQVSFFQLDDLVCSSLSRVIN